MLHQEDALKVCPYEPSHLIRPKRMITHLAKCRKNHLSLGYQICPMDATHHVPPNEFEAHMETCPKRFVIDSQFIQASNTPANPILPREVIQAMLVPTDENWDDDASTPTYDAMAQTSNRSVIRILKNARPAERKAFQMAERRRLIELQEKEAAQGPLRSVGLDKQAEDVRMPMQQSRAIRQTQPHHN